MRGLCWFIQAGLAVTPCNRLASSMLSPERAVKVNHHNLKVLRKTHISRNSMSGREVYQFPREATDE